MNKQIQGFKKIEFELVQNYLLEALNICYLVKDAINDIIDSLKNITYDVDADTIIANIKNGNLKNAISTLQDAINDADQALSIINFVDSEAEND